MKTLVASEVVYYSYPDEASFFARLEALGAVGSVVGRGLNLFIDVDERQISDDELRELFCIFYRYGIDMKQLSVFIEFGHQWILDPNGYWYGRVFEGG